MKRAVPVIQPQLGVATVRRREEQIEIPIIVVIPDRNRTGRRAREAARGGDVAEALRTTIMQQGIVAVAVGNREIDTTIAVEISKCDIARVAGARDSEGSGGI